MTMRPFLRSIRYMNEALEPLNVIESTSLEVLDSSWRYRSDLHSDYHKGRKGAGDDFLYY